jgi:hypothetical protein
MVLQRHCKTIAKPIIKVPPQMEFHNLLVFNNLQKTGLLQRVRKFPKTGLIYLEMMKLKFIRISAACVQKTTQDGWYVQTSNQMK